MLKRPERKPMVETFREGKKRPEREFKPNWGGILMMTLVVGGTIGTVVYWVATLLEAVMARLAGG